MAEECVTVGSSPKAWQLIEDYSKWNTGCLARDKDHYPVDPQEPAATCWCAIGAVIHVYGRDPFVLDPRIKAVYDKAKEMFGVGIIGLNDYCRDHQKVIQVLKECDL